MYALYAQYRGAQVMCRPSLTDPRARAMRGRVAAILDAALGDAERSLAAVTEALGAQRSGGGVQ